jgi:probable F420-dependent oxidoreductase
MAASLAEYVESARRVEALGYTYTGLGDHFGAPFEPGPALTALAMATALRVRTVFDNDFRHPALLAKEAASIDVLTGGRLQFGIGAGWLKEEYDRIGLAFDPAGVRVGRLEEAIRVVKGLWAPGTFTFTGRYYTVNGLDGTPKPIQRPHPPIFIGGGGRRLLSLAAREADVVGIHPQALPGGGFDMASMTEAALAEKIGWVRAAAGTRFDQIALHIVVYGVAITDDRAAAAARFASAASIKRATGGHGLTAEQVIASPQFLIGSLDEIVERLLERRERYGISAFTIWPSEMEAFAPVLARLAGR